MSIDIRDDGAESHDSRFLIKGHDDATAILLAIHLDNIDLLGISTVSLFTHFATDPQMPR